MSIYSFFGKQIKCIFFEKVSTDLKSEISEGISFHTLTPRLIAIELGILGRNKVFVR